MAGDRVDVVVVGGGLSGLRAARALADAGVDVVVLEARDRVGGRTLSQGHEGRVVDLGGQWIAPTQTRVLELVGEQGLRRFPTWTQGRKVLERRGGVSTYARAIPRLPLLSLGQLHLAIQQLDRQMLKVPPADPASGKRAAAWDAVTVETMKRRFLPGEPARELLDVVVRAVFGAEPGELSFLHFLFYLHAAGGVLSLAEAEGGAQQWRLVEGAQTLSQRLAEPLGDRVVLEAPARRVVQSEAGVEVETDRGTWSGRFAVVAMAPPLAGRIEYDPPLPSDRDQLCQRMPMGATIKCLAFYETPFWRNEGLSGEAVSSLGPLSFTYDNSAHDGAPYALVGFIVGAHARRWSQRPPEERKGAVLRHLAGLFGDEAAEPIGWLEQDWSQERWTRGCPVANLPPGAWTQVGHALRRPVGRLHWAGTESATEWAGYMEGALQAGDRVADEILARLPGKARP